MIPRPSGTFSGHPEGYVLDVGPGRVSLRAGSDAGYFYGLQTLSQLPRGVSLHVEDQPRFPWRGVMLDVARHFMPVPSVLRFLDLMAMHKLNVLHLHLTDDQGWRFEVPGWPLLTDVGAWRSRSMRGSRQHDRYDDTPHGGFYTVGELRAIVAFAAARHITVVPEVDMPGHMQAAIAAYPSLGNGYTGEVRSSWGISPHVLNSSPDTVDFCRAVLGHVCDIFPSAVIGIGGDEADFPDQAGFTAEVSAFLATRGRRVYGWDEILVGGAPKDAVIAAWRGELPAVVATRAGQAVVSCPDMLCYLDYRQSDDEGEPTPVGTRLTLDDIYAFEPVPSGADPALIIGAQANLWTEHMESARRVDYMAFPRLCAFAETVWSPPGRDPAGFHARLAAHLPRLDALGVNYRPLSGPRPEDGRPGAPGNPRTRADRLEELAGMTSALRRS